MDAHKKRILRFVTGRTLFWIVTVLLLLFFLAPLLWMISTSFKNWLDAFAMPPRIFFVPTLENYQKVFGNADFMSFIRNSVICSVVPTLVGLLLGVPAAYAIAVFECKQGKKLSTFIMSVRIAPPIMSILPNYIIFAKLDLLGTLWPMLILYTLITLPMTIWLMPVYFRDVPMSLREAAIIDGCNEWQAFTRVMLPLVKASIAATAIMCLVFTWNEFLIALIMSGRNSQTLPVAITSFMTFQGTEWGPMCAAATIIMLPMMIFGFFVQKYFARGMVNGAVKG